MKILDYETIKVLLGDLIISDSLLGYPLHNISSECYTI